MPHIPQQTMRTPQATTNMHVLREWGDRIEGLTEFIARAMESPACQGVVLDLNPIWLAAWRTFAAGLDPTIGLSFVGHPLQAALNFWLDGDPYIDLKWHHREIQARIEFIFRRNIKEGDQPFLVKAIALPVTGARAELAEIVRSAPFPAIVETRPPANLAVACGDSCAMAGGLNGTIGGFLRDSNAGTIFAATCGHIVPTPGVSVSAAGAAIGNCAYSQAPTPIPAGQYCRPGASCVTPLDLALVDIGKTSVVNTANGIATAVYPTENVQMNGAVTPTANYVVSGVCLTYIAGRACFDTLFEVRPPVSGGAAAAWTRRPTIPQQGDSGAWVERRTSGEWCGILTATDSQQGYAQEASAAVSAADNKFGTQLVVI